MTSPINLVEERAAFANRINTLELEAEDDFYTPTKLNDDVLPETASDLGAGEFWIKHFGELAFTVHIF